MLVLAFFYSFILIASCALTWAFRRYALINSLLDIPNHRSSHVEPTPRGGGLAFVFCFILVVLSLAYLKIIHSTMFITLVGFGTFIAILGFLDDHRSISAKWRLPGHFIACGFALYFLGGMPDITIFSWTLSAGLLTNVFAVFYLAWLLNLFNFMDGIDGIAAVEAVTVCLSGVLIYFLHHHDIEMLLPFSLAVSVSGFLFWNFPPARIFMGDAGSSFLGFVLGLFSIQAAQITPSFFWSWLILLGVFIVDASVTLLRRAVNGERVIDAHRNHAYQHACRYYGKHRAVTLRVLIINLSWLLPLAIAVSNDVIDGFIGLLIAYIPLVFLAFKFNAGKHV